MTATPKTLFRGAATTTVGTTLYTTPTATTTVVTSIVVTNTAASSATFTLGLGGVNLATTITIGSLDSTVIDLRQALTQTQTITGGASATTINFHISGVEIS
jgi:hypothetical protein